MFFLADFIASRGKFKKLGLLGLFVLLSSASYFLGQWSKVCPVPKPCEAVVKIKPVTVRSEVARPLVKATGNNATKVAELQAEISRLQAKAERRVQQTQPKAGCPASCVSLDFGDVDLINQARDATED